MREHVAACPACGEAIEYRFPRCARKEGFPTPLYVEINGVAQYLIGATTFVEFLLTNVSDEPVRLASFEVRLGAQILTPGIHQESGESIIRPEDNRQLLLDRKVSLDIHAAIPGVNQLHVRVAFSHCGRDFVLEGDHPIRIDPPGADQVHCFDPLSNTWRTYAAGAVEGGRALPDAPFGETVHRTPPTEVVRASKEKGLRFFPLKLMYTSESGPPVAQDHRPSAWPQESHCPKCNALLLENGDYCHACGTNLENPPCFEIADTAPSAYCPHCAIHPLTGRRPYCTQTGKRIHLYLEVNELSFFMQDVQTLVSFKIHPVHDREIHLRSFNVSQPDSDAELGDGPHSVGKDLLVRPAGRPCEVQKLFYPRTPRPERGVTGCPPGNVRLDIALEYETQDMRYRLKGPHLVTVLPNNADPQAIQTYIGDRIEQTTGSGPTSGGAHYKEYHVQVSGVDTARKAEEFVRKMQDEFGLVYKPVLLHLSEVVTPPDWPPMTKARLSFVHEGVPQNYCLLPQKSIVFGRSTSHVDMRLFEVERCNANMRRQEREGVPKHKRSSESQVGRVQWRVEPTPESVRVASLRMTEAMTIQEGEIRLLKRNEQVTLREVIGLKYVGDANALEELDECRKSAREILSKMKHPPRRREDWTGPLGGYCLARLFSLTGKPVLGVEGAENLLAAEYYVLIPGWITLGASKDEACIQIPGKDMAAVHAAILFVDGYYFLVGLTHRDDVAVDGKPMPSHTLCPLKPGAKIQLGATTIQFAEFSQLFI